MSNSRPAIVGITPDTHTHKGAWRYELTSHYAACVEAAGATPVVLPYQVDSIPAYLDLCDAFILAGGDDPDTAPFGEAIHPRARPVVAERQRFELELLRALDAYGHPVLGICLGMQWMALHHGGRLHQHLPDAPGLTAAAAAQHAEAEHDVLVSGETEALPPRCRVFSKHHQAVADAGTLRVLAVSDAASGSVIEAVDRPGERFYLGVQWHPERTAEPAGGVDVFHHLVAAARSAQRGERSVQS